MEMNNIVYSPLLKTRDAELRGMENLSDEVLDKILPIYELTKSRKSKKAPDGDIHKRMMKISEIQKGRPFVLDLCTDDKYINPQIEQLINETDGYYDWRYFLNLYDHLNIIPMVHLYDDEDFSEVEHFVAEMSQIKSHLAVRLPYDLDDISKYILPIVSSMAFHCKLLVFLDADFIRNQEQKLLVDGFIQAVNDVPLHEKIEQVTMLSTSFPRNPASLGEDHKGEFGILEEKLFKEISNKVTIGYGDYASINTEQVEIMGGTFVPRIDVCLDEKFIYKRYRRHEGSYERCASEMVEDPRYKPIDSWADNEIMSASKGNPSGISPSFWISVRINYYITKKVMMRLNENSF